MMMEIERLYSFYLESGLVSTDTRKIIPGSIFFALKGDKFNANEFAKQALDLGAGYAVIDEPDYKLNDQCLLVDDVLQTLQQLAAYHRAKLKIPVIGLTGSNERLPAKNSSTPY